MKKIILKRAAIIALITLKSFILFGSTSPIYNNIYSRVTAFINHNGEFADLSKIYGLRITYYLAPQFNTIIIGSGTHKTTIEFSSMLENSFLEWSRAAQKYHTDVKFVRDYNYNDSSILVIPDYKYTKNGVLGGTKFTTLPNNTSAIKIYFSELLAFSINYKEFFIENNIIKKDETVSEFIKILLKSTLTHEIGHALGLGHPEQIISTPDKHKIETPNFIYSGYLLTSLIADTDQTYQNGPSIMVSGAASYGKALSSYLDRTISCDDIKVTKNDGLAIARLFNHNLIPDALSPANIITSLQDYSYENLPVTFVQSGNSSQPY